ncbi:MAG: ketoacyl-ACP synthase III [bacterium]|nr:ketoacyl-ACP synthase III [bacterium]
MRSKIVGTGMCVPDQVVTNDDLAVRMDTSDEWIRQRTGIQERRWISPGQTPADLARGAVEQALEQAELEVEDIECLLLATLSSQHDFPGTSFFVHEALGMGEIPCVDLRAQCSGFLYALNIADGLIVSGKYKRILVMGCEVHSTGIDISTRGRDVSVIFGDGAGAVIVEAQPDESDPAGIVEVRMHAEGKHARRLWIEAPTSSQTPVRLTHEMIDDGRIFPHMEGRYVFKHAVIRMPEVLVETLNASSMKLEDVDLFLFHQANLRINESVSQRMGIPEEKLFNNIQKYGNCSAASIPMLLAETTRNGRLRPGQLVSMTAFGSGFTWASALVRW